MDRNQAKEFYPILQAFAEGKTIEARRKPTTDNNGVTKDGWYEFNDWSEMKELEYWVNVEYRIKPEPKYRPFKDAIECWTEMLKHKPFGWVKTESGTHRLIVLIDEERLMMGSQNVEWSYRTMFDNKFTFADGFPFGVKLEE